MCDKGLPINVPSGELPELEYLLVILLRANEIANQLPKAPGPAFDRERR
jgi:hypothetical protein